MFGFKAKSVDSIIADIQTRIAQLHVVADIKEVERAAHDAAVTELLKLRQLAYNESIRAKSIAQKFEALIS